MKIRPVVLIFLSVVGALILAFPLRGVVESEIVQPLAYLFWVLGILYRAVPQPYIWLVVLLVMFYVAAKSFYGKPRLKLPARGKTERYLGPVENMARLLAYKKTGVYFKWQVARTLSEIGLDLQELRQHVRSRELGFPADTPLEVQKYLTAGLKTSFADYPSSGGFLIPARFRTYPKTPFDIDLDPVVQYLEAQLESQDDRKHP
jgi:hypothetical protein